MSLAGETIMLFGILVQLGLWDKQLATTLLSVDKKPPGGDIISQGHTETTANCLRNQECETVLYKGTTSLCYGYKSTTEDHQLAVDEVAWHLISEGDPLSTK